jgi:tetratricopeptide (TPR) repeat protein
MPNHVPNKPSVEPPPTGKTVEQQADTAAIGEVREQTEHLLPPSTERYQFIEEIAHGGMGIVFRSFDTLLGREVAVKVLAGQFADRSVMVRRFIGEARITGQLQHPNIPAVHELGTLADGEPFLAMRLIKGRTLDALLKNRGPGSPNFIAVFEQICQAMGYAHDRKVIHRDLKPANVMVGAFGEVQLMDWGLAKVLSEHPESEPTLSDAELTAALTAIESDRQPDSATRAGSILGTPGYMPPEQAIGAIEQIDERSDVFGLGAILCAILTSKPPFVGSDSESTRQLAARGKLEEAFARLDACGAEPELITLCKRCLAPEKPDRPANAGEVAEAVADLRAGAEQRALQAELDRATAEAEAREQRKRRRVQVALAGAIGVLILACAAFAIHRVREQDRRHYDEAIRAEREQQELSQLRAEIDQRHVTGLALARAGDTDRAIALLAEAVGICGRSEALGPTRDEIDADRSRLDHYRSFRADADTALRDGIHNIRNRKTADLTLARAEAALAAYDVERRSNWEQSIPYKLLSPEQAADVKRIVHELLVLVALRLAMFDTRDEEGKANTRRALALLDRAAAIREPGPGIWMIRMLWNRRLGNNEAADKAGDTAVRLTKEGRFTSALDHYLLGSITLHVLKRPKDAANSYLAALKLEPNHYGANFGLYVCYSELKDFRSELVPLSVCLALRPDEPELCYFRGYAYFNLQDYKAAHDDFDASVHRDPKYKTGYFYRGRTQVVFNKWNEAEKDFTRTLDLDPAFTQCRSWRAIARAKIGRYAEAAEDAEQIVKEEPTDNLTNFFAARAYAQAVKTAGEDKDATKRKAEIELYGKRSVELLGKAAELGFKDWSRVGPGSDFDPVRDREDFKTLMKRLNAPSAPIPKEELKKEYGLCVLTAPTPAAN